MRIKLALAALLLPVVLFAQEPVTAVPQQELPPAVVIGGKTKAKYLLRPGAKAFGDGGIINFSLLDGLPGGRELGSVVQVKKPFLVKDILLSVHSNHIPGCVASINIYSIEGNEESFVNVLGRPIHFNVAISDNPQPFDIRPDEDLLLEPGKYFIAFQVVGYDEDALQAFLAKPKEDREFWEMTLDINIFLKSSYLRKIALGEMEHYPVNIGLAVKGLEYQ